MYTLEEYKNILELEKNRHSGEDCCLVFDILSKLLSPPFEDIPHYLCRCTMAYRLLDRTLKDKESPCFFQDDAFFANVERQSLSYLDKQIYQSLLVSPVVFSAGFFEFSLKRTINTLTQLQDFLFCELVVQPEKDTQGFQTEAISALRELQQKKEHEIFSIATQEPLKVISDYFTSVTDFSISEDAKLTLGMFLIPTKNPDDLLNSDPLNIVRKNLTDTSRETFEELLKPNHLLLETVITRIEASLQKMLHEKPAPALEILSALVLCRSKNAAMMLGKYASSIHDNATASLWYFIAFYLSNYRDTIALQQCLSQILSLTPPQVSLVTNLLNIFMMTSDTPEGIIKTIASELSSYYYRKADLTFTRGEGFLAQSFYYFCLMRYCEKPFPGHPAILSEDMIARTLLPKASMFKLFESFQQYFNDDGTVRKLYEPLQDKGNFLKELGGKSINIDSGAFELHPS